jgi:autotransporter-associated beta strand protein
VKHVGLNPNPQTHTQMKNQTSFRITIAGLLAAALLFTGLNAGASIVGPYTTDVNTLHLWHLDELAAPAIDAVSNPPGTNCINLANGATLGTNSYAGFGTALSTGQDDSSGAVRSQFLSPVPGNPNTATGPFTFASTINRAFTLEANVLIGFDPAKNLGTTANGGNNRNAPCQIMAIEGGSGARIFQFRISHVGTAPGGTGNPLVKFVPYVTFENVTAGQPTIFADIPTNGPDAILSNQWYHVAVSYNGVPSTTNNIKFYWTLLNSTNDSCHQIPITSVQTTCSGPTVSSSAACSFEIGNQARNNNGNFLGLIDEVRISNIERGSGQMMFAAAVVGITSEPASQFVAAGDNVLLSVGASGQALHYQWQFYGTNLPSATNSTLVLSNVAFSQAGPYQVTITNSAPSSTNSTIATITVGNNFSELFNGGLSASRTLLSGGDVDPHWQLVHSDDPSYPGPAAVVVGSPPGTYLANGPSSMWLAPVASGNALSGFFNYRTSFLLDTIDSASAVLNGGWAMDNYGVDILLNGVSVGLTAVGFGTLTPFAITNGYVHAGTDTNGNLISITNYFVPGLNTLECVVSNAPSTGGANPTGLRVEVHGVAFSLPLTAPYFTSLPGNVTTQLQQSATFSAVAVGSGPLTYQWYRGATLLAGQTQRTLALSAVGTGDAGTYTLWVTNSAGFTNATATLTVISPPALAWLGIDSSNPSFWDTVTVNWLNTGSATDVAFAPQDDVLFDIRGAVSSVDLVQPLTPNSITVDSTTDYTLMSSGGLGAITGSVPLTKKNSGTLILDVTNISSAPVTILGGTVQIGNGDANGSLGSGSVSNNGAITFMRYDTFVVPNTLSGTGAVTMAGSGTVVVSGHNTYTGPTIISSGILSANSSAALGSTGTGTTVNNGGQLLIYGDVTLDPEPLVLSGSGPGTGALHKGTGAATTFGGPITLAADAMINLDANAMLNLTNAAGIAGTDVNLDLNGGASSQGSASVPVTLGIGGLTKDGAGTWTLTATNNAWSGGITVNTGTLQIGTGATNCSFGTGTINVNGGTLNLNSAPSFAITNDITVSGGTAAFTSGTGLAFSGAILNYSTNTFTSAGPLTVSGTIQNYNVSTFTSSGPLTLPASIHNDGTLIFNITNSPALSPVIDGAGGVTLLGATVFRANTNGQLGAGTCTIGNAQAGTSRLELTGGITLANQINIFPRAFYGVVPATALNVSPDIVNVSGTNTLSPPASITIGGGGDLLTLQADIGKLIYTAGVTSAATGRRLALRGVATGEFWGNIDYTAANSLYVFKLDSGTWSLWGTNTPGQSTTISNGVLVMNGTMDTNLITVAGGSLAGTGVLSGPVVVNAGAKLAPTLATGPATPIGTLTVNNTLTLQPGSFTSLQINKAASTNDQIIGLTSVSYGGTLSVTNLGGTLAAGDAFQLFNAASYTGAFSSITPTNPGPGLSWNRVGLNTSGLLSITKITPPTVTSTTISGKNLIMSGTGGAPGGIYLLLSSTNVVTALTNWTQVTSGVFDGSGNFVITNAMSTNVSRSFFTLKAQ